MRQFCKNNPGHKIYRWMLLSSTQYCKLLYNPTIIHRKTFFALACHLRKIYRYITAHSTRHHTLLHNPTIIHTNTFFSPACHLHYKIFPTSKYNSKTNSSCKISPFYFFRVGVGVMVGVRVGVQLATLQQSR